MSVNRIIRAALQARTPADAESVQHRLEKAIGKRCERPIADRWNNSGFMKGGGSSFDHKVIELVTNMQDGVLERLALEHFGDLAKVPYSTPLEAAQGLFNGAPYQDIAEHAVVEFHEAGEPANRSRRMTMTFRDRGCGLAPKQIPMTIFRAGSSHKEGFEWFQGAYGMGGIMTYLNAEAVIVVTRRDPALLPPGEEDRISIAVVQWQRQKKTPGAFYLVTKNWESEQNGAVPFSVPAAEHSDFEPGMYLALISYGVEGYHRARLGDERSFDTVLNTRLVRPVMPVRFTNHLTGRGRNEYLRGLERRLLDNPRSEWKRGEDTLPLSLNGKTYHLPIRFWVFTKRGDAGERRKFVAYDHAVLFTSNGQVHHHWTPQHFRYRTDLNKLYDRVLVVVDTDELPIAMRSDLFSADRSQLIRSPEAIRLEEQVVGFLNEWHQLREINGELIREAISGSDSNRPTIGVAKQISRALKVRGFSIGGVGTGGGGNGGGGKNPRVPIDLYNDPTTLEGPERVRALHGTTKFVNFVINAKDSFMPGRGQLVVTCDHPEIGNREITVGPLHAGLVRVSIAVPLNVDLGEYELKASLAGWHRAGGGLGPAMKWSSVLETVDELRSGSGGGGSKKGKKGAGKGDLVALIWTTHNDQEGWDKNTVGSIEMVSAKDLSSERTDYADLAALGDTKVPTILLNTEFHALKSYVGRRARDVADLERVRNRYAVGSGVGLILLHQEQQKRIKRNEKIDDDWVRAAQLAVGRSALSMMPAFDELAKEAGVDDL